MKHPSRQHVCFSLVVGAIVLCAGPVRAQSASAQPSLTPQQIYDRFFELDAEGLAKHPVTKSIAQWVKDLDSDKYRVRTKAVLNLTRAGKPAVVPVAFASFRGTLEARLRARKILRQFLYSKKKAVKAKARATLRVLAHARDKHLAQQADDVLSDLDRKAFVGTLTTTDARDRTRRSSYCKIYTMKMEAGRTYTIDLTGGFDTYLRIETMANQQVAADDDGGQGLNSRLVFRPTQTTNYRVIVTSFGANATGNYTLQIVRSRAKFSAYARRQ